MTRDRGPYIAEDEHTIYLPVSDWSYNEARREAVSYAESMDPWIRTRYEGKLSATLHDHDGWEECETCPPEPAWTFTTYEGTWRS